MTDNEYKDPSITRFTKISSNRNSMVNGVTVEDILSIIKNTKNSDVYQKLVELIAKLYEHITNKSNPHKVTQEQLMLSVLDLIYSEWLYYGNDIDFNKFKYALFEPLKTSSPEDLTGIFDIDDPMYETVNGIVSEIIITVRDIHFLLNYHIHNEDAHKEKIYDFFKSAIGFSTLPIFSIDQYDNYFGKRGYNFNESWYRYHIVLEPDVISGGTYSGAVCGYSIDYKKLQIEMQRQIDLGRGHLVLFRIGIDTPNIDQVFAFGNIITEFKVDVVGTDVNDLSIEIKYILGSRSGNTVVHQSWVTMCITKLNPDIEGYDSSRLSHVALVWAIDEHGAPSIHIKRKNTDSVYSSIVSAEQPDPLLHRKVSFSGAPVVWLPPVVKNSFAERFLFYLDSADEKNIKYLLSILI